MYRDFPLKLSFARDRLNIFIPLMTIFYFYLIFAVKFHQSLNFNTELFLSLKLQLHWFFSEIDIFDGHVSIVQWMPMSNFHFKLIFAVILEFPINFCNWRQIWIFSIDSCSWIPLVNWITLMNCDLQLFSLLILNFN